MEGHPSPLQAALQGTVLKRLRWCDTGLLDCCHFKVFVHPSQGVSEGVQTDRVTRRHCKLPPSCPDPQVHPGFHLQARHLNLDPFVSLAVHIRSTSRKEQAEGHESLSESFNSGWQSEPDIYFEEHLKLSVYPLTIQWDEFTKLNKLSNSRQGICFERQ
jgi:hypothetical protein